MRQLSQVELAQFLIEKADQYAKFSFVQDDPIQIPHAFSSAEDIEISALIAATLSWGNRKTIIAKSNDLMDRMDRSPAEFIRSASESDLEAFNGFVHRTFQSEDIKGLARGLKMLYQEYESLGAFFKAHVRDGDAHLGHTFQAFKGYLLSNGLPLRASRMKALIQVTPIFDQEMTQIYSMARLSKVYEFLHYHISTIKMCMYLLLVLLNLNILMASYGGMPVVLTNTTETLKVVHYDSLGYETLRQDEDPPAYGHEASFKSFPGAEKQVYDFQDYDVNKSLILSRAFAWVNLLGRIQIHYFCSSVTHSKHQTLLENYEP